MGGLDAYSGAGRGKRGEASSEVVCDETRFPQLDLVDTGRDLLLQALARDNMQREWKCLKANKGAFGIDGLDILQTGSGTKNLQAKILHDVFCQSISEKNALIEKSDS